MSLPPLTERDLGVLVEERERLQDVYRKCAEVLGPYITPSGARALDRINDAVEAITKEIESRTAP